MKIIKVDEVLIKVFTDALCMREAGKIILEALMRIETEKIKETQKYWKDVENAAKKQYPNENIEGKIAFDQISQRFLIKE